MELPRRQCANKESKPATTGGNFLCTATAIQRNWSREHILWLLVTTVGGIFMLISPQSAKSFFLFII